MKTLLQIAACLLLLLTARPASSQTTNGAISGRITDSQRAALNGVMVRAKSADTGVTWDTTTDREGAYRLGGLPAGTYELVAELAGFRPFTPASVTVNVGLDTSFDFTMRIAPV